MYVTVLSMYTCTSLSCLCIHMHVRHCLVYQNYSVPCTVMAVPTLFKIVSVMVKVYIGNINITSAVPDLDRRCDWSTI